MGNCCSNGGTPNPDTSNQRYKMLIIGASFSGKTTFLKSLQMSYGNGFDEVSMDTFKDIITKQMISCMQTILDNFSEEEQKLIDDDPSFHSEMMRDQSHLSHGGGSQISMSVLTVTSMLRNKSQSARGSQTNDNTNTNLMSKKFENAEIAQAAEYFLSTNFSRVTSYAEWLSDKKFIENLNLLWNNKQIQNVFSQNYYLTTKLPYSTKYFIESIVTKMNGIFNELNANNEHKSDSGKRDGYDDVRDAPQSDKEPLNNDEMSNQNHSKQHSTSSYIHSSRDSRRSTDVASTTDDDGTAIGRMTPTMRFKPNEKDILLCYHRTINRNKEKISLPNKLSFEIWDVGGSKSEMKKWILYSQRTNIVVFMVSLYQVSMLKYTHQLWENIVNSKYEQWFGVHRPINSLVLMASDHSQTRTLNSGSGRSGDNTNQTGSPAGTQLEMIGSTSNARGGNRRDTNNSRHSGYQDQSNNNNNNNGNNSNNNTNNNTINDATNESDLKDRTVTNQDSTVTSQGPQHQTVDIRSIPCFLILNGRTRLTDMIEKEKINVKLRETGSSLFFQDFTGDPKNADEVINFIQDRFIKAKRKESSKVNVFPIDCDCIDKQSVQTAFEQIQEIMAKDRK